MVFHGLVAEGGMPLLNSQVDYTINQMPSGPLTLEHVAKKVPAPKTREQKEQGWVTVFDNRSPGRWEATGWRIANPKGLAPDDPTRLWLENGTGAWCVEAPSAEPLRFELPAGPFSGRLEVMLPVSGNATVHLGGWATLPLSASALSAALSAKALRPAGEWNALEWRVEPTGLRVVLNDHTLQERWPVVAVATEAASFLELRCVEGALAIRSVRVRPESRGDLSGTVLLLGGEQELADWRGTGGTRWDLHRGAWAGEGGAGALVWKGELPAHCEVEVECQLRYRSRAALALCTDGNGAGGFELVFNTSHPHRDKNGSLTGFFHNPSPLIGIDDTWVCYGLECRETDAGIRLVSKINGLVLGAALDRDRRNAAGKGLALRLLDPQGRILVREVRLRSLEGRDEPHDREDR
jgi:hypothetical protein